VLLIPSLDSGVRGLDNTPKFSLLLGGCHPGKAALSGMLIAATAVNPHKWETAPN